MSINNLVFNSITSSRADYPYSSQRQVNFGSNNVQYNLPKPRKSQAQSFGSVIEWYQSTSYSAFNPPNPTNTPKGKKVGFGEGTLMVLQGAFGGAVALTKFVAEHLIETAVAGAGVFGACRLFPIVGVTSFAAGSVMALGFEAMHIRSTCKNTFAAIGHGNKKEYDKKRVDLYRLGVSLLCLAIVTPFVTVAISQLKIQSKLNPIIGFNKEHWNNIKNAGGVIDKLKALFTGDPTKCGDSTLLLKRLDPSDFNRVMDWAFKGKWSDRWLRPINFKKS